MLEPSSKRISVPMAALEHHAYCARQAALIHVDAYFESNVFTTRGDLAHAAVDVAGAERGRGGQRVWQSLPVWSDVLGIHGVCDVVEFHDTGPIPVEHKSGSFRPGDPAEVQLAGQVLCLREMFGAPVPVGVIFAGRTRRRFEITVDPALADRVVETAEAVRLLLSSGELPAPVPDRRCRHCSLRPGCEPTMPVAVANSLFRARLANLNDGDGFL